MGKYSFDKEKVIDADYVEKAEAHKAPDVKKKLSFGEKFQKFSGKVQKLSQNIDDYKKKSREKELENLTHQAKKSKLQAQISKSQNTIDKTKKKKKQDSDFDFDFGFKF